MWTDPRDETAAATLVQKGAPVGESLDPAVVAALLELGDVEFFAELVDDFVTSTRTYLGSLEAALDEGDAEAAYKAAHTMKSSAANMGASDLSELCRVVEAAGRAGDLGALAGVVDRLVREFERVQADLAAAAADAAT